jgi:transposase
MIGLPSGTAIWLVAGITDMRKGFNGLSALVQTALAENPFSGQLFVFRGRRGDRIKVLWPLDYMASLSCANSPSA